MSDKSKPLPSILAQMRNATRSISMANPNASGITSTNESRGLVEPSSSFIKSPSSYSKQASSAVSRLLSVLNSSSRTNLKSKKQKSSKFDHRFHVTLPQNFLIYTILVFIVLPLTIGSIFLIKQLLFGIVREDETHHLRKKEVVHLRPSAETVENVSSNVNSTVNFAEKDKNTVDPISKDLGNSTAKVDSSSSP